MNMQTDGQMIRYAQELAVKQYGQKPVSIVPLGGGFYGSVFLAELDREPFKVVIKIYLLDGLNGREAEQLVILGKCSTIKMPQVYFLHDADGEIPVDALAMEYIDGINAGGIIEIPPSDRDRIADRIIDNLISFHSVVHPEGFGEIAGGTYEKDWRVFYRGKACAIYHKAFEMRARGKLSAAVCDIVKKAYDSFDLIFSEPVETARLIHGDYNTWNVLVNHEETECVAVIDPFNCCWADSELDLYQLSTANGQYFGLLDKYRAKVVLSSNFEIKNSFYELFTEIMHHNNVGKDPAASNIPQTAGQLEIHMKNIGI